MVCAQTGAVGDTMVVGLLLFLSSQVCQVADPSLPSNLEGLLLGGMAFGDKHAKLLFSGWP